MKDCAAGSIPQDLIRDLPPIERSDDDHTLQQNRINALRAWEDGRRAAQDARQSDSRHIMDSAMTICRLR